MNEFRLKKNIVLFLIWVSHWCIYKYFLAVARPSTPITAVDSDSEIQVLPVSAENAKRGTARPSHQDKRKGGLSLHVCF